MTVSMELPRYKCHKEVWALKIKTIDTDADGTATITPEDSRYAPFLVSADYVQKHSPTVGGYWVRYKGGYQSYSPADVFEDGYSRVN